MVKPYLHISNMQRLKNSATINDISNSVKLYTKSSKSTLLWDFFQYWRLTYSDRHFVEEQLLLLFEKKKQILIFSNRDTQKSKLGNFPISVLHPIQQLPLSMSWTVFNNDSKISKHRTKQNIIKLHLRISPSP